MIRRFLRPEVVPFVEVELVRAPESVGPIVEVEIIPVTELRRLQQLQTLSEIRAVPQSVPKLYTKLDRAIGRKAARLEDKKKLEVWARAVKERDRWLDRKTGVRVRKTRDLDPLRAEAHHIESRDNWATRYDVRNGLTLSFAHHYAVTTHQYRIEGTAWFVAEDGCRYIDGTYPIHFVRL